MPRRTRRTIIQDDDAPNEDLNHPSDAPNEDLHHPSDADDDDDDMGAQPQQAGLFKLDSVLKQVVPLTLTNFDDWKASIQDLAYARDWPEDLLDHKSADELNEDDNDQAQAQASPLHKEAYLVLLYSVPRHLSYLYEGVPRGDANGIWKRLHARFQQSTITNTGVSMAKFWTLTMESEGLPVDRFIAKIRRTASMLKAMGREVRPEECTAVMLKGLLREFHAVRTSLRRDDPTQFEAIVITVRVNIIKVIFVVFSISKFIKFTNS